MTDRPFTRPLASSSEATPRLFRPVRGSVGETNDGAPRGTTPQSIGDATRVPLRRNRLDANAIKRRLSQRDLTILGSVAVHGFMSSAHIAQFHFTGHATPSAAERAARRVLERLRAQRVLGVLERRIGGVRSGSSGLIYYVDAVGDRVLRLDDPARPRRRFYEPTTRFLDHTLAIVDVHLSAVTASRNGLFELVEVAIEKQAWRRYNTLGGGLGTLKPDLAIVTASGEYEDHWWVEVDRGQESIRTVLRKCHDYEQYRRTGQQQAEAGVFPQVLWVMSATDSRKAARRRTALSSAVARDSGLTADLYRMIEPSDLVATLQSGASL
jgi:hypothetical protein